MRSSAFLFLVALGAVAVPAAGQDEAAAGDQFQFVCPRESAPAFLDGIPVPADRTWERLDDIPPGGTAPAGCWAWSDSCPSRVLEAGQSPAAACRAGAGSTSPLSIRMLVPEASNEASADGTATADGFEVVAAPVAMWRQVPWNLLPTITVRSESLSLLRSAETWRVQALAGGLASTWRDAIPDEGSVELSLRQAVEFTVQATAGGAPLAGARMYLVRPGSGMYAIPEPLGFGITNADGRVNLTLSERERSAILVSHVARTASAFERFDETPPVVELRPGFAVTGRTVDPEGLPVAGARLLGLSWVGDELAVMQRHLGLSGSDGRFLLSGFAKGAASLRTDGGELEYSRTFDLEGPLDLGSIVLMAPEHYWIQVVDASRGTPIPEARALFEGVEATTTGRDGLARVSPRFGRVLLVNAKGYRTARFQFAGGGAAVEANPPPGLAARPVDVTGDIGATAGTPLVLRLAPAFTVEGVFVAADGVTPAASGRLVATERVAGGSRSSYSALAADGSFSLDIDPGAYTLELTAANAGRRVLEVSGSAGEARDLGIIIAPASTWVSGTVVSPEYAPVPGARISYVRPTQFGALMARAMGRVAEVAANADGYFEMHGLELGPSSLRVEAEGFAPLEFEIEAAAIQWVDAGFVELSRGRRITVRSDVDDGTVRLDPGAEHDPLGPMTGKVVDGEALFENVPEEPLRVRVLDEGVPVCERREEAGPGDEIIRCDRSTVTVTGLVTVAGQPGKGRLNWQSKVENPQPEGIFRTLGGSVRRSQIVSSKIELTAPIDGEGRYRLESMLPGEWNVTLFSDNDGWQQEREVTVPDAPGEEVALDFHYGGVSIDGIVVGAEGQPVTHATVDIFPGRRAVVTGRSGRYEIMDLAPGAYQLRARFQHSRSDLVDVELRDYNDRQSVRLDLRDDPTSDELAIRLAGGVGGFCFVEMEGAGQRTVRIDGGVASTQLTPPLTDRVRVACRADGRWVLTGWQPLEPALERGVDLDPFESESSIVLTGEPSMAAVQVTGPGGWDLGSLRIWFGGATTFSVGETISNLPEGEYTLRWGNQVRTVWTERRRAAEVEIE
ncbi:MAG: carboxypeptidase regulatory-like domain-containing protein [Holophagales bacterium]|nr:carboxypeptidase regulatory-like domain-containing protein [Holophagales bacterium]